MKVFLLYPGISGIGFRSYGRGLDESWINHGLCSISAYAKRNGFNISLVDLRTLKNWHAFAKIMRANLPDVVGITMTSVDYLPAIRSIKIIKRVSPNTVIVVGGPHPSIMPQELEKEKGIDFIVTGEGEISFTELLKRLEQGKAPGRIIKGVVPENLDTLPFIDRTLFKNLEYPLPCKEFNTPFVTLIVGRGCRYNCNFCQPAERLIFGDKVRRRSPENVIAELKELREKINFKSMMIHDDCLTEDKDWVRKFSMLYKEGGFTEPFACQSRADLICNNEEMISLMASCGLRLMFIGFESGNQRVLNFLRKGTKVQDNYRAAEICRKHGIKIWANYMLGNPTETKEEIMDTVKMIKAIKPDYYSPSFFTPHPGSDMFKYCQEHNLSLIKNHNGYRRNPTEAKIKGQDYKFLRKAVWVSMTDVPYPGAILGRVLMFSASRYPFLKSLAKKILAKNIP